MSKTLIVIKITIVKVFYYELFVDLRCFRNEMINKTFNRKKYLMEKLSNQEEELMLIIFQQGKGFIKDFIQLMEEPHPPYTTVASIVKNLERKGLLVGKRYGNTYEYSPVMEESEYKSKYMSQVVQNYFEN